MKRITIELTDNEYNELQKEANEEWLDTEAYITIAIKNYKEIYNLLESTRKNLKNYKRSFDLMEHRWRIAIEKQQKPNKGQS